MKKLQQISKIWDKGIGDWLNVLKSVIANFDIKPERPVVQELLIEINEHYDSDNLSAVIETAHKILKISPKNYDALQLLCHVHLSCGNTIGGYKLTKRAVYYYPQDYKLQRLLGSYLIQLGRLKDSAVALRKSLKIKPDYATAIHLLNAVTKVNTKIAPRIYIEKLFDDYADNYDVSLLNNLKYQAHSELVKYLQTMDLPATLESVLDLGCGTGLLGHAMQDKIAIKNLIGVDLAANMLDKSRERNIYNELHQSDIIEYLQQNTSKHDLITSTDVLVYIGDLEQIIAYGHKSLKPGGYFGFTVEVLNKGTFKLDLSGRYQHSLSYITTLSSRYSFSKIYSKTIDLRKEYGNIVAGYLVLLQK